MSVNLSEAIMMIKQAGANRVRAVPMPGQHVHEGKYQIEILGDGGWGIIVEGIPRTTAQNIISQATNRVLLG